jgi:hypothetical protein
MHMIFEWFRRHEWLVVVLLALVFVALRLPGTGLPLHQDEYKWPLSVNPNLHVDVFIPHPPVGEIIYRTAGYIVGFNTHFRFVPLFFGMINLLLLYYFVRFLFGKREAAIASVIWIFSYYSILASLMVDTDGEVMPFFFLLALIAYYKLRVTHRGKGYFWWAALLVAACVLGFLVKVSFLLAIAAILADFLWSKRKVLDTRAVLKYVAYIIGGVVALGVILFAMKFIFPFFNFDASISYWEHFAAGNRDWLQTFIQCAKAVLYLSPFLVLVPFFGSRKEFSELGPLFFFLIFAFLFYVVIFDFSIGALDRYLQLLILPLTVLSTAAISSVFQTSDHRTKEFLLLGSVVALLLIAVQFFPHYVPSLHPKTEWLSRILHLKWNFLYPFSGGSGPLGFYVSFLTMAFAWIFSIGALLWAQWKPQYARLMLLFIIPIGLSYNMVFAEEYLVGKVNGYAPGLVSRAVEFIKNDPDISKVTVYNDNGGNEIQQIGKYRKRLYVDPKFDVNEKLDTLNRYKEHYFVLNVPRIDPTSVYQKYFDTCAVVYRDVDHAMSATVFDCRGITDVSR